MSPAGMAAAAHQQGQMSMQQQQQPAIQAVDRELLSALLDMVRESSQAKGYRVLASRQERTLGMHAAASTWTNQHQSGCWFLSVAAFPIGHICTTRRALTVIHGKQHNRLRQGPSDESLLLPPHPLLPPQGFPRPRVLRALLATHSEHMQAALDWILAAGADPSMDAPFTGPEPSQVSRQELQQLATMRQQQQQQQVLMPGWGMGSVAAAAGAAGVSGAQASGVWPAAAGPFAGSGGGAAGSSSMLNSSSGGPAGGYSNTVSGSQQQQQQVSVSSSRVVGIAGIMHREAEKSSQTSASLAVAFRDLDNLMDMAADMVKLAEKFRGVMGPDGSILLNNNNNVSNNNINSNSNTEGAAAGGSGEQLLLDADTQLQLIAMGIASPVTKASAGARYHQELSRQLADFLAGPLARAGGVLMLPDVYCLFNRARGSELVSPDDLLQACEAFPQVIGLTYGFCLSGVCGQEVQGWLLDVAVSACNVCSVYAAGICNAGCMFSEALQGLLALLLPEPPSQAVPSLALKAEPVVRAADSSGVPHCIAML
jgi:hypothetical protein